jgi:hypothetical protein
MPLIQSSVSIAGLTVNDNVLAGSQWEFLPFNARLDFGVNGDANGADLKVDIYSGTDVLCEQLTPNAQNRVPIWPDDFNLNDVAAGGERIKIRVRNTNAASRTLFYAVRITQIA